MMVTANQLHVSASNRPSSGCTHKEKGEGCTIYIIYCIIVYCTALTLFFYMYNLMMAC